METSKRRRRGRKSLSLQTRNWERKRRPRQEIMSCYGVIHKYNMICDSVPADLEQKLLRTGLASLSSYCSNYYLLSAMIFCFPWSYSARLFGDCVFQVKSSKTGDKCKDSEKKRKKRAVIESGKSVLVHSLQQLTIFKLGYLYPNI